MVRGKIKKMMAAALAATMVFTMTACGSDSEEKTADGTQRRYICTTGQSI